MEKPSSGYKKLIVWQESKKLVLLIYKITESFPKSEEFALKGQMRRAAVSVLSQISEGWLRKSIKDKLHFLEIALGSLLEVEAQEEVAFEIGYINKRAHEYFDGQRARVSYLLYKYSSKIKESKI